METKHKKVRVGLGDPAPLLDHLRKTAVRLSYPKKSTSKFALGINSAKEKDGFILTI